MSVKERLKEFVKWKKISISAFCESIGVSNAYISSMRVSIQPDKVKSIALSYPELNIDWLLTGNGDMILYGKKVNATIKEPISDYQYVSKDEVPLIPIDAAAGFGKGDMTVMEAEVKERYSVPEFSQRGVKYMIRVSGSSMYPKYSNGDVLACKPITDLTFFQWGKVYVLDTDQGAIVKRLYPGQTPDTIECRSDNKEHYPPFQIHRDSIRSVSIVVGVIRLE